MAKPPKNHGVPWSPQDVAKLKHLARGNTPTRLIALKMERTEDSIRAKAQTEGISLKPVNQRPYGTRP